MNKLAKSMAKRMADPERVAAYKAMYEEYLATPESEREYLLRRLNSIWSDGLYPGPADYRKVREDRKAWEVRKR